MDCYWDFLSFWLFVLLRFDVDHLNFDIKIWKVVGTVNALVQGYPIPGIMVVGNPLDNKVVALEEPPLDSN